MLSEYNLVQEEEMPQTSASGVIAEIRSAVMDGDSYYFLRLEGDELFYALSASENPVAVILDAGDRVTIQYELSEFEASDNSLVFSPTVQLDGQGGGNDQSSTQQAENGTSGEAEEAPAESPASSGDQPTDAGPAEQPAET